VIANGPYTQVHAQSCADGCLDLVQRGRMACTLTCQPFHLRRVRLIGELDQTGVKGRKRDELG